MKLRPKPPAIPAEGFAPDNDLFELKPFGLHLSNLVINLDESLVLLIDSPWGSGKSTFARQWAAHLTSRGLAVIYFDAFENDHHEDVFTTLAAEISKKAAGIAKATAPVKEAFVASAKKVGAALLPTGAKILLRVATAGVLSGDDVKELGENLKEAAKAASDIASDRAEALVGEKIAELQASHAQLGAFKDSLARLAAEVSTVKGKPVGPLVFIIDELDRCRPDFALNILERVKHFFSVSGLCFVLVAHKQQLEAIVRGSYGDDFDAKTYLQKFYHLRVILPTARITDRPQTLERYARHLWRELGLESPEKDYDERMVQGLSAMAVAHGLELRGLEHVLADLSVFLSATGKSTFRPDPFVVVLSIMRLRDYALFEKCCAGTATWFEVQPFLGLQAWPKSEIRTGWYEDWWRGALDPNWNDERGTKAKADLSGFVSRFQLTNAVDGLKYVATAMSEIRVT